MRVQDGILRLQDGSWRPKNKFTIPFTVYKVSRGMGSAAFAEPMGDFFGGPKNEVRIDHVLIQNLRPGADGFSSLREDRRPLDQGVRKMEGAGWREPMDWSTVSFRSVFGSFLIDF